MAIVNIVITMFTNVINYFPNEMDKKNIAIDVVVVVVVVVLLPQIKFLRPCCWRLASWPALWL